MADLIIKGKVDYIVTDDIDILIFGGNKVLKNFTVSDKKKQKIQEINLDKFKKEIGLNQDQLIDLAILLGCDYCPSFKGIGYVGAYKLIKKYGDLETIIQKENLKVFIDLNKIKDYFKNPTVIDSNMIKINKLDYNKIDISIFLKKFKFRDEQIQKFFD